MPLHAYFAGFCTCICMTRSKLSSPKRSKFFVVSPRSIFLISSLPQISGKARPCFYLTVFNYSLKMFYIHVNTQKGSERQRCKRALFSVSSFLRSLIRLWLLSLQKISCVCHDNTARWTQPSETHVLVVVSYFDVYSG